MTWNGEWKATLPFSKTAINGMQMFGIALLTIDGREVKCEILAKRGQTFARALDGARWFQLVR